jgi:hypothetical protein
MVVTDTARLLRIISERARVGRPSGRGRAPALWALTDRGVWVRCRGLTRTLRSLFYPRYDMRRAMRRAGSMPARDGGRRRGQTAAMRLGSSVDRDVGRMVAGRPSSRTNRLARYIMKAQEIWGWTPMASQVPVAMPSAHISTLVDQISVDDRGGLVLLENKTGYRDYLNLACGPMEPPMHSVDDSPINQHHLQLMVERAMLRRVHGVRVAASYVLQVTQDGVSPYALPPWADALEGAVWNRIEETARTRAALGGGLLRQARSVKPRSNVASSIAERRRRSAAQK